MTWTGDTVTPEGHKMSFHQALHIVSMQLLPRIALPDWVMGLTERLREIALGFTELRVSAVLLPNSGKGRSKT
jgi:hypothetical protein